MIKRLFIISLAFMLLFVSFVTSDLRQDCLQTNPDIVSYYKLNGNYNDSVGSFNAIGDTGFSDENNKYAFLNERRHHITISNGRQTLGFGSSSFTIYFYLRPKQEANATIIDNGYYKVSLYAKDGDDFNQLLILSVSGFNLTTDVKVEYWNFIAFVVNRTKSISLYVDGNLKNSTNNANLPSYTPVNDIKIGGNGPFDFDELAFFGSAHNQDRILINYDRLRTTINYCEQSGTETSSIRTDFLIQGCYVDSRGLPLQNPIPVNTCSRDGTYFCVKVGEEYVAYRTDVTPGSCNGSFGGVTFVNPCCPFGFLCNATGVCEQSLVDCKSFNNERDCEENNCVWIIKDGQGICVQNARDYSCSLYSTEENCKEDKWNLGREGVGTDICDTNVKLMQDGRDYVLVDCRCEWDDGKCYLRWDTKPMYRGINEVVNNFTCGKFFFIGECKDGLQKVNWTVKISNGGGIFTNIQKFDDVNTLPEPQKTLATSLLITSRCKDGETERNCGDSMIKLPFFSSFSLFMSVLVIVLFYVAMRQKNILLHNK